MQLKWHNGSETGVEENFDMIIYVKINQTHKPGKPPIQAAWKSWRLGRLLDDHQKRNSCKYLIAIYGREIIASYCVHAIAPDSYNSSRRVRFQLIETDKSCSENIANTCAESLARINQIPTACGYIKVDLQPNCACIVNSIPVLKEKDIQLED